MHVPSGIVIVLQQLVERLVLFRLDVRHLDVGFPRRDTRADGRNRAHCAWARVCRLLIFLADGGMTFKACAVQSSENDPLRSVGHFGDVFGMNREHVGSRFTTSACFVAASCCSALMKPEFMHSSQHVLSLSLRRARFGLTTGLNAEGLRWSRQHRSFGDRQFLRTFAKIDLRRRAKTISALPQENLVDVQLENQSLLGFVRS